MNREELIQKIEALPFGRDEFWLVAGGAVVLYGMREETSDIDLGCNSELANLLQQQGYPITFMNDGTRKIDYNDEIEIFENWLSDKVVIKYGIPVVSITGLIHMKQQLGREKDLDDMKRIQDALAKGIL